MQCKTWQIHVTKTKIKSLHVLLSNFFHPFVSVSSFPSCHFGKLYGVVMALSALFSLLQYPCFALVKGLLDGDPLYVSTRLTIEITVKSHPLYLLWLFLFPDIAVPSSVLSGKHWFDSARPDRLHPSHLRLHPLQKTSQGESLLLASLFFLLSLFDFCFLILLESIMKALQNVLGNAVNCSFEHINSTSIAKYSVFIMIMSFLLWSNHCFVNSDLVAGRATLWGTYNLS